MDPFQNRAFLCGLSIIRGSKSLFGWFSVVAVVAVVEHDISGGLFLCCVSVSSKQFSIEVKFKELKHSAD